MHGITLGTKLLLQQCGQILRCGDGPHEDQHLASTLLHGSPWTRRRMSDTQFIVLSPCFVLSRNNLLVTQRSTPSRGTL